MKVSEFKDTLDKLAATNSRNEKKEIIGEVADCPAAISFLSGSEFDSAGLGKKTVHSVAETWFGDFDSSPTVSEALDHITTQTSQEGNKDLSDLRSDMETLADLSGNEMEGYLLQMFEAYDYPSVVAHACLNDWPTGVGDSTIATAMGVKESLPFYEGVVEIAEAPGQLTRPVVGRAFKPMLAKSESSLPDDVSDMWAQPKLDGYRIIIHVKEEEVGQSAYAYTRRMNDVTPSLPELEDVDWPEGEYIFDGEVIAEDGTYKSTSKRVGRKAENVEREQEMEFGLFDIIVNDGKQVWHEPYRERHHLLHEVAGRSKGVSRSTHFAGETNVFNLSVYPDLSHVEARAIGSNYEGLIWKDPEAPYKFDERSKSWIKDKNTAETVDVKAVDFIEGEGRLDGTLGKIHLDSADGEPLGATGSGFSDEQRDEIWENQDEYLGETLEVEAEAFDEGLRFPIFKRWRIEDGEPDTLDRVEEVLPEP